jgi:phosphate transport system substrate-binding protein
MNRIAISSFVLAAVAAAAAGSLLLAQDASKLTGRIKVDGSSTVAPITTAVAEEFKTAAPGISVTVGISGTGGGFKRFVAGETDISDASRPIKKEEHDKCVEAGVEYIELPVAYDGLSIVVNYKNDFCHDLTLDEIKRIFTADSSVHTWKDIRPDWPAKPIKIFSPGTDSGTFDYFKEVVVGDKGAIRSDMSVSEDDNVLVTGIAGDEFALGFFGYAYFQENQDKVKAIKIDGGKGSIEPTVQTIENGTYAPFSRPLFIYVNKKAAARPEVKAFVQYFLGEGLELVSEVGYVKLPAAITDRAKKNFGTLKTGTQFINDKGEKVHGPLAKVYN